MMDEQKVRLIRLLEDVGVEPGEKLDTLAGVADYLLWAGVLVPPARVGDPLWWVCDGCCDGCCGDCDGEPGVREDVYGIRNIYCSGRKFGVLVDGEPVEFGTQYAFFSREDAEKWAEEHGKEAVGNG